MGAAEQQELGFFREPKTASVPVELIWSKRTEGEAFKLACEACTNKDDKEIASDLGLDAATFSRIKSGKNTLNANLIARFCKSVGNTIYVQWIAYQINYGLVLLKSEAERRAEELQVKLDKAEEKLSWAMECLQGKK